MRWRFLSGGLFLAVSVVSVVYAFCTIFSQFATYDDEGYMMLTVQGFLSGHRLYDEISSFYGPVYYFYEWIVHGLFFVPLSHNATRMLTLVHWMSAAGILALAGFRMTRSGPIALLIFVQAVPHLFMLSGEPGHPQEIAVILLAVGAVVAASGAQKRWTLPLLGSICAALALTKINVGVFFGVSLFLAVLCHSQIGRYRRFLCLAAFLAAASLPFLLMKRDLGEFWAQCYALYSSVSIVTIGIVAFHLAGTGELAFSRWLSIAAGFAGATILVLCVLVFAGSSLPAALNSLVLEPAKMGGAFCYPLRIEDYYGSVLLAAAGGMFVVAFRARLPRWPLPIAFVKLAYGVTGALIFVRDFEFQLGALLPWTWVILLPRGDASEPEGKERFVRVWLCFAAVFQGLQAYPVAGAQVSIGTFLPILAYSFSLYDGMAALIRFYGSRSASFRARWSSASILYQAVLLAALLDFLIAFQWLSISWKGYASGHSLDLPGARWIRTNSRQSDDYKRLAALLSRDCDTFITIPGINSLYFWTGKNPPAYIALGGEGVMASRLQQARAVAGIRKAKRSVIVLWKGSWPAGVRIHDQEGPLLDFVRNECHDIGNVGPYRLLAPNSVVANH